MKFIKPVVIALSFLCFQVGIASADDPPRQPLPGRRASIQMRLPFPTMRPR